MIVEKVLAPLGLGLFEWYSRRVQAAADDLGVGDCKM